MENPIIFLAFTDDWELRGDGSGDIERIQFQPMRELLAIFERHGARCTFMAEIMQQLTFRANQGRFPQLKSLADAWDDHVRDAFIRGHDVQLHIHNQWSDAEFINGEWQLRGDWSILDYEPDAAEKMISAGRAYLENLLKPIDPDYKCVAFRGGYSAIAPSTFILDLLAKQGIVFDLSIIGGLRVNTRNVQLDYTVCEEDFLPFYPEMTDARKLSNKAEPIICVPVFHFIGSRSQVTMQITSKVWNKIKVRAGTKTKNKSAPPYANDGLAEIGRSSVPVRIFDKVIKPAVFGKHLTADVGQLGYSLLCEMIGAIRSKARTTGLSKVPVVLTNHSKYMKDYAGFERFLHEISVADDIKMITLAELANMLETRVFDIKKSA